MLLARILLLAFGIGAIAATSDFTVRCLVTYLRGQDINEELFADVETVSNYTTECGDMVSYFYEAFFNKLRVPQRFQDCLEASVNSSGLKNAYILTEAVERLDVGWKKWKIPEKNKRIKDVNNILNGALKFLMEACYENAAKEDLAAEFDKIVTVKKTLPESQEFCVQKHLAQLGILNVNTYNLTFFAKSINYEAGNCDLVISPIQDDYYRELQKNISDCIVDFYRQNHFQEYYLKVEYVLAQADLSQFQMTFERDSFVKSVLSVIKKARIACGI